MTKTSKVLFTLLFLAAASLACNFPQPNQTPSPQPTYTPISSPAPPPIPTLVITPTNTPTSTPTHLPTLTETSCEYAGAFNKDVTIPDGTQILPDTQFTKTWRFHNLGCLNWTNGMRLTLQEGSIRMQSNAISYDITPIPSGYMVDVSITFTSPHEPGFYISKWLLTTPSGQILDLVWVEIEVISLTNTPTVTTSPTSTLTPTSTTAPTNTPTTPPNPVIPIP